MSNEIILSMNGKFQMHQSSEVSSLAFTVSYKMGGLP